MRNSSGSIKDAAIWPHTSVNARQYNTHYYNIQHTSVTVNIARKSVCVTVWSMIMNHNINFDCKV